MSRRAHVSKDLLKQAIHYLKQYNMMLTSWSATTYQNTKPGVEREEFRKGLSDLFEELQSCVAKLQEEIGEEVKLEELQTEDFKAAVNRLAVQRYVYKTKNFFSWRTWVFEARRGWGYVVSLPARVLVAVKR